MVEQPYSLVVLGCDIHATSIAAYAAQCGLKVALVSQVDFGEHSTKNFLTSHNANLLKLERLALNEVARNTREEKSLAQSAPHWAQNTLFYVVPAPLVRSNKLVDWGLSMLRRISAAPTHKPAFPETPSAPLKTTQTPMPHLGYRLHEQRLSLAYAKQLQNLGGKIFTRTKLMHSEREPHWQLSFSKRQITAGSVINCTGCDVVKTMRQLNANSRCNIMTHTQTTLIVRKTYPGEHGYILQSDDKQLVYVAPINSQCMIIGPMRGGDDTAEKLLALYNNAFNELIQPDDILHTDTIERPLYEDPTQNTQAYLPSLLLDLNIQSGTSPLVNVFGTDPSKHRIVAERALNILSPHIPRLKAPASWMKLETVCDDDIKAFYQELRTAFPKLKPSLLYRLAQTYGDEVYTILKNHSTQAQLGQHFGGDLYAVELRYLVEREWVKTADDILWRRTDLGFQAKQLDMPAIESWLNQNLK